MMRFINEHAMPNGSTFGIETDETLELRLTNESVGLDRIDVSKLFLESQKRGDR